MATQSLASELGPLWGGRTVSSWDTLNDTNSSLLLLEVIVVVPQVQSVLMLHLLWTIFGSPNYSLYLNTETLVSGASVWWAEAEPLVNTLCV